MILHWLELIFGGGSTAAGQGRQSNLEWSVPWATWITLIVLIAATVYVFVIYAHEHTSRRTVWKYLLAGIRLSLIGLVLMMLYRFVLRPYRTDLPDLLVILDDSASMTFADTYDEPSRLSAIKARLAKLKLDEATRANLAKTLLLEDDAQLLNQLSRRYNVKLFLAGGSPRPLTGTGTAREQVAAYEASEPDSRLGRDVLDSLQLQRGRPTAAVIVLTDGITTEGKTIADIADTARRKVIPLFTIGLGNEKPLRDVWLARVNVDGLAFVGDVVPFAFRIASSGFGERQVDVRLKDQRTGRVLDQARVTLADDGQQQSGQLRHRPEQPGKMQYVVEVAAPEGDSNQANNLQERVIDVRDETIRVLLVQEYPNYEFRYLKNLLSRQLKLGAEPDEEGKPAKSIELAVVQQSASRDWAALDETALPVFPVKRDELFEYDVIIFGDVNPSFLSRAVMENIAAFVSERGGGIIFSAGPHFTPLAFRGTPLADLMPINMDLATAPDAREPIADSFQPQPTSLGVSSPQMQLGDSPAQSLERWQKLPGMYWFLEIPEVKRGARVLAEHPTRTGNDGRPLPIILMQHVGAGNVIFHASDETWRWRFRTGDALFGRYWLQTIRYLSRAKLLGKARAAEIATDREHYRRGDTVDLQVRFLDDREAPAQDDGVAVVVEQAEGRNHRITLRRTSGRGMFEATLPGLGPGRYRAWLATPTLAGGAPATEFTIEDPEGEMARLRMDANDLRRAAERSGGKFCTFESASRLLKDLPEGRQVPIEALDEISIWNSWRLACVFVALLVTEWLLRKRVGMV